MLLAIKTGKCDLEDCRYYNAFKSINQSINQSNFYSANIPSEARLSVATAKSVLNSKSTELSVLLCNCRGLRRKAVQIGADSHVNKNTFWMIATMPAEALEA